MLKLRLEAVHAIHHSVYARVFRWHPDSTQPVLCGTMFLTMSEWLVLCKILAASASAEFEFTHILHMTPCDKCGELSRVTCGLCGSQMCEPCWGDHPHAHGIHVEGSTK